MHTAWTSIVLLSVTQLAPCAAAPIVSHDQLVLKDPIRSADSIRGALKRSEVIPDVLDDFSPSFSLSLSYPSSHQTVSLGNTILPSDTSSQPVFEFHPLSAPSSLSPTRTLACNKTYTLVLTDPDATSRANPTKGQMCHWITTGISLSASNSSEGIDESSAYTLELSPHTENEAATIMKDLVEYMAPAPPEGTGKHRYVFVLLASEDWENGKHGLTKPRERPHWGYRKMGKGVREWANDNGLVAVGEFFLAASGYSGFDTEGAATLTVVGANFFYAQNKKQ
ncbi:hypothetical protein MMC30_003473 [Trapelia coarctata]|nr:hypothetical protein [Trapelia coarctata]